MAWTCAFVFFSLTSSPIRQVMWGVQWPIASPMILAVMMRVSRLDLVNSRTAMCLLSPFSILWFRTHCPIFGKNNLNVGGFCGRQRYYGYFVGIKPWGRRTKQFFRCRCRDLGYPRKVSQEKGISVVLKYPSLTDPLGMYRTKSSNLNLLMKLMMCFCVSIIWNDAWASSSHTS